MQDILFDFISKYISLTEDEKQAIVTLDILHSVKKGTVLLNEGQKSNESYFVLKGCIRSYYLVDGEEKGSRRWIHAPVVRQSVTVSNLVPPWPATYLQRRQTKVFLLNKYPHQHQ